MIRIENLSKNFGAITAVSGLNCEIAAGEVVGLLGPNGAGKTTTMRMLTTFLRPSEGTAQVAGYDILKEADEVRRAIGYLPELPPLYPEMRVDDYLTFVAKLKGIKGPQVRRRVEEATERCALGDVRRRICAQLSRGFRQRVGIAQALIHQPPVVILDEPTSGLDPAQIIEIRSLIRGLGGEHTVLLSTHILPEVESTCSRAVIIAQGSIVEACSLSHLEESGTLEARFLEAVAGEGGAKESEVGQ